jgi:hypothetical protein
MNLVWNRFNQGCQESGGRAAPCLGDWVHEGKLAGTVDGCIETELAFRRAQFGDVDVKITDRVGFEFTLNRLVCGSSR